MSLVVLLADICEKEGVIAKILGVIGICIEGAAIVFVSPVVVLADLEKGGVVAEIGGVGGICVEGTAIVFLSPVIVVSDTVEECGVIT